MNRSFQGIAMELALHAAGHKFPRLSQVGAAWADDSGPPSKVEMDPPAEKPVHVDTSHTDGYGIFIMDVTWTEQKQVKIIEVNGSNAALTSSVRGRDDRRAQHMFLSYKSKNKPHGSVAVVMAYQKGMIHLGEFFGRAGLFTEMVSDTQTTRLCDTTENLGEEEVSVICGTIPDLADHITRHDENLYFKQRPVVFGTNPNLLAELVRRGIVEKEGNSYRVDYKVYHESHCTPLIHDKGAQQDIAQGTGIEPLYNESAFSFEECVQVIGRFHAKGLVAVGKMHAGSGGSGIEFFPTNIDEQTIRARLNTLVQSAIQKYGQDVVKSMYPIQFFEFAKSTDYMLYGEPRLWDLRLQCLVYPGYVEVTPCVIRLCPEAFDSRTFNRTGVVSNLTGRDASVVARTLRSPAARRRSQTGTVLDSIQIDYTAMQRITVGCAKWCESAWLHCKKAYEV